MQSVAGAAGSEKMRQGLGPLVALGIVFLLSLTGLLVAGSTATAVDDAPYRDGPLASNAGASLASWSSNLSPNAGEFFALICLAILLVGFRWAGLSQRDRMSR